MPMMFLDHVHTAVQSLKANRMRSILTTLGVAIGIASVTTILALAQGVANSVLHQIDEVGGNVAIIRPESTGGNQTITPMAPQQFDISTLTPDDVEAIRAIDSQLEVAPLMTFSGSLTSGRDKVLTGNIVATTAELTATSRLPIDNGQFIDNNMSTNTATIGQQLAIDLYGNEDPVGNTFTLRGEMFTIIGVFERMNNPVNYNLVDFDEAVVIHFDVARQLHGERSQIQQINYAAPTSNLLNDSLSRVTQTLEDNHGTRDFQVLSGTEIAEPTNRLFELLTRVMVAIAAISLLVGGIGIMNIMLVSVAERTREIGIRKSVGASTMTILKQFMIESIMISLLGGIIGVILGVIAAFAIGSMLYFVPVISHQILLAALGLALGIGILFGIYPALRAARKDPIESLRQYR